MPYNLLPQSVSQADLETSSLYAHASDDSSYDKDAERSAGGGRVGHGRPPHDGRVGRGRREGVVSRGKDSEGGRGRADSL